MHNLYFCLKYMKTIFMALFIAPLILVNHSYAQKKSDVTGTISTGPSIELLSVAVESFRVPSGFITLNDSILSSDMKSVLESDLAFSLYFNVVIPDSAFFVDFARGKMNLDDWIYLGAQMLISGRIEREGDGILFTASVTDVYRNRNVYSHDFVGQPQDYRYLMHRVASDILYNLTGEEGPYFSKLMFACDATGHQEIFSCDFDGYAPVQMTHDNSISMLPSWSLDGKEFFYTGYKDGNPNLYVYNISGHQCRSFSARAGLNSGAVPSPDGKYIAGTLSLGGDPEIYLFDSGGRIIKRLTFSKMIDTSPAWSPTSREIAFTSDRTGLPQIYVTDTDGLNTRRLTFQGDYNDQAAWSPRGDLIAYSSRERDGFQIYTVDITGGSPMRLTDTGSNEGPAWSPDGLHIAYTSNASGQYKVMVMDYNGLNKKEYNFPGNCKTPDWSRNIH
jgi:TolB protein